MLYLFGPSSHSWGGDDALMQIMYFAISMVLYDANENQSRRKYTAPRLQYHTVYYTILLVCFLEPALERDLDAAFSKLTEQSDSELGTSSL